MHVLLQSHCLMLLPRLFREIEALYTGFTQKSLCIEVLVYISISVPIPLLMQHHTCLGFKCMEIYPLLIYMVPPLPHMLHQRNHPYPFMLHQYIYMCTAHTGVYIYITYPWICVYIAQSCLPILDLGHHLYCPSLPHLYMLPIWLCIVSRLLPLHEYVLFAMASMIISTCLGLLLLIAILS